MKKHLLWLGWILTGQTAPAQQVLTLEQCQAAAMGNHPLRQQKSLAQQTGDLNQANLVRNRRLPQLAVTGQATWQSEVTSLPIELPNLSVPTLSKDQYKLTLDASYALYDGGLLPLQRRVQAANTALDQQRVEVELVRLKDQVNALYFNALLTDETRRLTQTLRDDLTNRIGKTAANVKFGVAAPTHLDALEAERLKTDQRLAELAAQRRGLRETLGLLTGLSITETTDLQTPVVPETTPTVSRPELRLYDRQRALADAQLRLADNRRLPRLSVFAQTGAGRPALNFLRNDFRGFFVGGLRLNWNLSNVYTLRNDKALLALSSQQADVQQVVFEKNLSVQLRQQQTEVDRFTALLETDRELVALRAKIRQAAAVQLDNGALASRDYVSELNAENRALLDQKLHELQRLLALVQYRTMTGN